MRDEHERAYSTSSPSDSHPTTPRDVPGPSTPSTTQDVASSPPPSSHFAPSSADPRAPCSSIDATSVGGGDRSCKSSKKGLAWTDEEEETSRQASARFISRLAADHLSASYPDIDTPFKDALDVVNRLLPYHVFQHPKGDLDAFATAGKRSSKGKEKASNEDLKDAVADVKFAVQCLKRKQALHDRLERIRIKRDRRASPDIQSYMLEQAVLESDRALTSQLRMEFRAAKTQLNKIEKAKRQVAAPPRTYQTPTATQSSYYRTYPYGYAQPFSVSTPAPTVMYPVTPVHTYTPYTPPVGRIPVQLPVTSLPALANLGIVPVPAASLPPPDQPQPPAILQGTIANETTLSLQVDISLLQPGQINGLASLLSSLVRGFAGASASSTASASASRAKTLPNKPKNDSEESVSTAIGH